MAAPTALTFNGFVSALSNLAIEKVSTVSGVVTPTSAEFAAIIPQALNFAELKIQRDAQLNQLQTSDATYTLISGNNLLAVSVDDFVAVDTISIQGTPLLPVSKEWLQAVWGTNANLAQPLYYAPYGGDSATGGNTSTNFIFGPWPDSNYPLAITGAARAASLNAFGNQTDAGTETTFISSQMPDVLLAASMIFVGGYQRNYGTGPDPQMPGYWEGQYQSLINGVQTEEARRKFAGPAWTAAPPTPLATPTR